MRERYDVTGMSCAACSSRVEKSVSALPGIQEVSVNLLKNSMVVIFDEASLNSQQIIVAVGKAGYGASLQTPKGRSIPVTAPGSRWRKQNEKRNFY